MKLKIRTSEINKCSNNHRNTETIKNRYIMSSDSKFKISDTINEVMKKVDDAKSSRIKSSSDSVTVVAVSKTQPKEAILEAYSYGLRHFGENYVNELLEKASDQEIIEKCPDIKWYFIGHLQSNKVNKLLEVPNLHMIQTIDSTKLALRVDKCWSTLSKTHPLQVMVQVNTSGEESKSGIAPDKAVDLIGYIQTECPHLECVGLMTIGSPDYDKNLGPNPEYIALSDLRDLACEQLNSKPKHLSMGMSDDYEHAIQLGSTLVRIGRSLFGARPKKQNV